MKLVESGEHFEVGIQAFQTGTLKIISGFR